MAKTKLIITGVLAVAIIAALVVWLLPDEKKAVRKQFARLSELAGKDGSEGLLVTASQAKSISELMTEPSEFKGNIPPLGGTYSQREVAMVVAGIRTQMDTMMLDLSDITIEFPEKNTASVTLTARLKATRSGEFINEVRELECILLKQDGKWLFNSCQTVEVFQK